MATKKNWIAGATKKKGALHKALGVPLGQKIAKSKIEKAKRTGSTKLKKEANLALTLEKLRKKKK